MRPRSSHTPHRPPAGGPSVGRAPCPASLPRKPAAGPVCPRTGRPTRARAATGYPEETRILLDLYARRQLATGFAFPPDTPWQRELPPGVQVEQLDLYARRQLATGFASCRRA